MTTRRITLRLHRQKEPAPKLHQWREIHQYLYNACIYERRVQYEKFGNSVNYFDQHNLLSAFKKCWSEFKNLGSYALQATVKRVYFAEQRFFNQLGKKPNYQKKVKASQGWQKARKKVSKLDHQVANQRQDWQHKVAAQIVSSHSLVAREKLNLKGMTHKGKTRQKPTVKL